MLDSQRTQSPKFPKSESWSINVFNTNDAKSRIVRKFINSAIYVEKPINEMPPSRKTSPYYLNSNSDSEFHCRINSSIPDVNRSARAKRCFSNSTPKKCIYHNLEGNGDVVDIKIKTNGQSSVESPTTTSSSDIGSQVTVKSRKISFSKYGSEMRLSLCSLTTDKTGDIDPEEKERVIKTWLQRKDKEKKRREMEELKMREAKETERQAVLEKERENFKKWLAEKKREEEKKKLIRDREKEENKLKEAEKEKRQVANELCFHMWLRRKKRLELEKNIKEKLALLQVYEDKQRRIEENAKAFDEWLQNSRNKPKPIPLNQGLKSLCSSISVTYINPTPWVPNIEIPKKPTSQ